MSSAEDPKTQELTAAQCVAVEKLVAGATVTEAATAAGVERTTVYRWMKLAEFKKMLIERRNDSVEAVRAETAGLLSAAVDTFRKALSGRDVSTAAYKAAADLLRAARVIGDNVVQAIPDDVIVEFADPNPDGAKDVDRTDSPSSAPVSAGTVVVPDPAATQPANR